MKFDVDCSLRKRIDEKVYEVLIDEALKQSFAEWDSRKEFAERFAGCADNKADFVRQRMLVHFARSGGVEVSGIEDYDRIPKGKSGNPIRHPLPNVEPDTGSSL